MTGRGYCFLRRDRRGVVGFWEGTAIEGERGEEGGGKRWMMIETRETAMRVYIYGVVMMRRKVYETRRM
jgi:hypothetical protein